MKKIILILSLIYGILVHSQNTYNLIKDGNWSDPTNWDYYPGTTIGSNDIVNIPRRAQVLTDQYITNNGTINNNDGTIIIFGGITLTNNGTIENEGSITNDGTINNNGILNNDGSMYSIRLFNSGTFTNNGRFQRTGSGYLTNTGTVKGTNISHISIGSFTNSGILSPGNSVGLYTVNNDYAHESSANLDIEVEESTTLGTDYDNITINGNASLNGTLTTTLLNGFEPEIGDSFTILTANSISGTFSTLNMPTLTDKEWSITYNSGSVVLTVNSSLSTTDFEENAESLLYPNPANKILYIKSNSQISRFDIYNNLGQLVLSKQYNSSINVSLLKQGVYYIKIINTEGLSEIKRFIKS